jgi:leucyl-tRNA synthetase
VLGTTMELARQHAWQARWAAAGLGRAVRRPDRSKFYALWTYPGPSGFFHVGHLRGLTLTDVLHRFERMRGRQVFFPMGTHASGLPAVAFAQRLADRDPAVVGQLKAHGVPESAWPALEAPEEAARFLGRSYLDVARRMGVLFDEDSYVTTIDEDYRAFIGWQFRRLREAGHLVQGPYFASVCPVCGPVSVDASETDLSSGGEAEIVRYTTVPFPLPDGRVLLAATLRPETVYGVTNVWIPEREPLVVWHHGETPFLVSRAGAEKLLEQHGGRIGREVPPGELAGRTVAVPFTGASVPVFPSPLVEPGRGTGVVMSVPGHAPADFLALARLPPGDRARIPAVPEIIFVPPEAGLSTSERELLAGSGPPAERAARATGAHDLSDAEALDEATERLYRLELARGRMLVPALGPIPVSEARARMEATFEAAGTGFALQEFSLPVVCRNGHTVVIRRVPDQWFLRYSDPDWKRATHHVVERLKVRPSEYARELPDVIDWYQDRPCTRRGRWLGTPLPFDPSWVIEPIADSTFYPAYYVVRRFVSQGRIRPEQLTDAFFDFVFAGRGEGEPSVDPALQREVREEFTYWYPLDLNVGGKEHKRVHFPVFLFNHAALLSEELQPRGILVNWWIVAESGEKISKRHIGTKGGQIPPIEEAFQRWGADALRLFYVSAASVGQDIGWEGELVDRAAERLREIERLAREALADGPGAPPELEAWLFDAMHRTLEEVVRAFDELEIREVAEIVYVRVPALLRRFVQRGGAPGATLTRVAEAWVRLLSPITPHLAEELGEPLLRSLVAAAPFPEAEGFPESPVARAREEYLERIEEDLASVLRPLQARGEPAGSAIFYVAAAWKRPVESWARGSNATGGELIREVMERARSHPELASARGAIAGYLQKIGPKLRSEPPLPEAPFDEVAALRASAGYLARRFRFVEVVVHPEEAAAEFDPKNRRERARPGRPAFYLTGPGAGSGGSRSSSPATS